MTTPNVEPGARDRLIAFARIAGTWIPFVVTVFLPIGPVWLALLAFAWVASIVVRGREVIKLAALLSTAALLANIVVYAFMSTAVVGFG